MKTLLALSLAGACFAAGAQTPANNPMPDGSRDLYLGVGAVSEPRWEGGRERRVRALPLLQFEFSNGVFISGLSAGMHLSQDDGLEYGPLLAWRPRRDQNGEGSGAGGVTPLSNPGRLTHPSIEVARTGGGDGLAEMDPIGGRLQAGAFANYRLTPELRLTNSLLYGAGKERDGLVWDVALQQSSADITAYHRLSWSAGATLVNSSYNNSYYGVSVDESIRSGHRIYRAKGGVQDVYLGAGWNWALTPGWLLVSRARVTRLQGDAANSPLVQRSTNVSISTGLAYRF